jgi:hypothetical protein
MVVFGGREAGEGLGSTARDERKDGWLRLNKQGGLAAG